MRMTSISKRTGIQACALALSLAAASDAAAEAPAPFTTTTKEVSSTFSFLAPLNGSSSTTVSVPQVFQPPGDSVIVTPRSLSIDYTPHIFGTYTNSVEVAPGATIAEANLDTTFDLSAAGAGQAGFPYQSVRFTCIFAQPCHPFSGYRDFALDSARYEAGANAFTGSVPVTTSSSITGYSGTISDGGIEHTGSISIEYEKRSKSDAYVEYHQGRAETLINAANALDVAGTAVCAATGLAACAVSTGLGIAVSEAISQIESAHSEYVDADDISRALNPVFSQIGNDFAGASDFGPELTEAGQRQSALLGVILNTASMAVDAAIDRHYALALDPPDPDYDSVLSYEPGIYAPDTALGADFGALFTPLYNAIVNHTYAMNGALVSLERAQGAAEAGAYDLVDAHLAAYNGFASQLPALERDKSLALKDAYEFILGSDGIELGYDEATLRALIDDLESGNIPEDVLDYADPFVGDDFWQTIEGDFIGLADSGVGFNEALYAGFNDSVSAMSEDRVTLSPPASVPAPASLWLLATGLFLVLPFRRRLPMPKPSF